MKVPCVTTGPHWHGRVCDASPHIERRVSPRLVRGQAAAPQQGWPWRGKQAHRAGCRLAARAGTRAAWVRHAFMHPGRAHRAIGIAPGFPNACGGQDARRAGAFRQALQVPRVRDTPESARHTHVHPHSLAGERHGVLVQPSSLQCTKLVLSASVRAGPARLPQHAPQPVAC